MHRQILLAAVLSLVLQPSGYAASDAPIGAIVLTLRHKKDARRQRSADQLNRKIEDVIDVRKVQSGQGVEL